MAASNDEESQFTGEGCRVNVKVRVAAVAARQIGRVRHDQVPRLAAAGNRLAGQNY